MRYYIFRNGKYLSSIFGSADGTFEALTKDGAYWFKTPMIAADVAKIFGAEVVSVNE